MPESTSGPHSSAGTSIRLRRSVEQLLAAKNAHLIWSPDDLAAGTFVSDQELQGFLSLTYAERRRGLA